MEKLFLLNDLYYDPLALSRCSQFRCFYINKGETIQDLNESHEFQVCFVLKGALCYFKNTIDSISQIVMENEFFFISGLQSCKIRAISDSQVVIHACNIIAPYLHSRIMNYLQDIEMKEVVPVEALPVDPLIRSFLDLLVNYMQRGMSIPELHRAKEYELFSLFKTCYTKSEIAAIFSDALSNELRFFVSVMNHYKGCRTAKDLAAACGYNINIFNALFKKCFHGETPYQWLQRQSATEIKMKLVENRLPIKQIMLEYNFKTFSHFTTFCKRNIGAAPNEIRRKNAPRT